jgi:amino acid transporter
MRAAELSVKEYVLMRTGAGEANRAKLRGDSLGFAETLGQSIANIGPTLTPALNIAVVAGIAGIGAWLSYLIATVGLIFVAANIGALARRHPQAGAYFVYIGRALGPLAGMIAGWSMLAAYLFTAIAVVIGAHIFLSDMLHALGLGALTPRPALFEIAFIGLIWACAYRDVRLSSRLGLALEALSLAIIVLITAVVVAKRGTVIDYAQLRISRLPIGRVMAALAFAMFSFVGFESAATLAKEARDPVRAIPRAVTLSAAAGGLFFVLICYCMMIGVGDQARLIGDSASPFAEVTRRAGLAWAGAIVYFSAIISGFACGLASINAMARMLFSMGRYEFVHRSMGTVHERYRTPHLAVTASCMFAAIAALALSHAAELDAFGYTGTFATFGFIVVYLLTCVAAPAELYRAGELSVRNFIAGALGIVLMAFAIAGSLIPVPSYPYSLLPYLFLAYLALGGVWYGVVSARFPHALSAIELDLEA